MVTNIQLKIYIKRIESLLFYLFIFCIPFQTRIILANWAPARVGLVQHQFFAKTGAGFNEWTAAFLYGTDILIFLVLTCWLIRSFKTLILDGRPKLESKIKSLKISSYFLVLFFAISAASVFVSHTKSLSLYQLIKLAEFIAFYFYIRFNLDYIFDWKRLVKVLVLSGFFQAIIAILQYTIQGALGLKIFGESPITPSGPGIASFYVSAKVYLRAYGTFPHPNILAVFLMLSLVAFFYLYFKNFVPFSRALGLLVYATILYAFFATYSRTVIGFFAFTIAVFLIWAGVTHSKAIFKKKLLIIIGVSLAIIGLFVYLNWVQVVSRALISSTDEAVSLRLFYDKFAGQTTGHYPWLGVGIGAFVAKLMQTLSHIPSYYYQPAHNIYLLISAETGIFGIASFLVFLFFLIRNYIRNNNLKDPNKLGLLLICFTLLAIGLFDHFLWTIQQGRIIFWLVLALL